MRVQYRYSTCNARRGREKTGAKAVAVLPVTTTMTSGSGVRREILPSLNRNKVRVDDEGDESAATFDGKRLRV